MQARLETILAQQADAKLTRKRLMLESRDGVFTIINKKKVLNFSGNDYLGLSTHPDVKIALSKGIAEYGFGSGSSSVISGFYKPQYLLEEAFCEFLNRPRCLFFNSGYHANIGIITALTKRNQPIIADKYCHASLLDGIHLSRGRHIRFKHNNVAHAELLMSQYAKSFPLLISESIFSMEGNISPIPKLATLAKNFQSLLLVDDAHGLGILGENGKGVTGHFNLTVADVPLLSMPLGKAFGGMGAMVSGSTDIIENILQFARTYIYSTALPPALCLGLLETLKIISTESWRRAQLFSRIKFFIEQANARGIKLISNDLTPIKCVLTRTNQETIVLQEKLLQAGFLVACIRQPSVPKHLPRLKITLNTLHSEEDILRLLDILYLCLPHA